MFKFHISTKTSRSAPKLGRSLNPWVIALAVTALTWTGWLAAAENSTRTVTLDKPLKIQYCEAEPNSVYTVEAEQNKAKGVATFQVTVGPDGRVRKVQQTGTKAGFGLDDNIRDYYQRCRFVPRSHWNNANGLYSFTMGFKYDFSQGQHYFQHSAQDSCTTTDFFLLRGHCF